MGSSSSGKTGLVNHRCAWTTTFPSHMAAVVGSMAWISLLLSQEHPLMIQHLLGQEHPLSQEPPLGCCHHLQIQTLHRPPYPLQLSQQKLNVNANCDDHV